MNKKIKRNKKDNFTYNPSEWDESATVEINPEPRMKAGLSTSIRLPVAMVNKLRKIAAKK